jgi:hypothetical protein
MKKLILSAAMLCLMGCGQGPQGVPGTNGSNGTDGTPGTAFTIVQFCPNVVPTYPTTFPEVGFCIQGSLYAVYSANDGFLTEIPPGTYTSNAVGSACNFTVAANCAVSN